MGARLGSGTTPPPKVALSPRNFAGNAHLSRAEWVAVGNWAGTEWVAIGNWAGAEWVAVGNCPGRRTVPANTRGHRGVGVGLAQPSRSTMYSLNPKKYVRMNPPR